jgi:hypothetical protein
MLYYGNYDNAYPKWHNIFKHSTYGPFFTNASIDMQYGGWMKNSYEDIYYRHNYNEGGRILLQDISITYATDAVYNNTQGGYSNYDDRRLLSSMMIIVNKDMIRGNFEMYCGGGIISRDSVTHMGNGWSYQCKPIHASMDIRIVQQIYVKYGVPVKVVGYFRKDSSYNGSIQPYIMARGFYQSAVYSYMPNTANQWVRVELNFTPARSEMIEIGVGGRGTTGLFWMDPRVSVTTFDLDLIQGPYSTNLMFGLDQIYADNPSVVLSGITI